MQFFLTLTAAMIVVSAIVQDATVSSTSNIPLSAPENTEFQNNMQPSPVELQKMLFGDLIDGENSLGFSEQEKMDYTNELERWLSNHKKEDLLVGFDQILNSGSLSEAQQVAFNLTKERQTFLDAKLNSMVSEGSVGDLSQSPKEMPNSLDYPGNSTFGGIGNLAVSSTSENGLNQNLLPRNASLLQELSLTSFVPSASLVDVEMTSPRNRSGSISIGNNVTSTATAFNGNSGQRNSSSSLVLQSGGNSGKFFQQAFSLIVGVFLSVTALLF